MKINFIKVEIDSINRSLMHPYPPNLFHPFPVNLLKLSAETTAFPDFSSISFRVLPATAPPSWATFFSG
jgi:hypothetical protein